MRALDPELCLINSNVMKYDPPDTNNIYILTGLGHTFRNDVF